eukprot:scaffold7260_cov63-Phaeocystis_antarctica.AAC.2
MPRADRGSAATDRPRQGKCRVTAPLTGCAERPLLKEELPCAGCCALPRCSLLRGLRQALAWRRRAATLVIVHWTWGTSSEDWKHADASRESRLFAYSERQEAPCRCLGVLGANAGGRVANVAYRRAGHPPLRRVALNVLFEPQDAHLCKLRRHECRQASALQRLNAAEEAADRSVAALLVDSDVAADRDLHGGGL